MAEIAGYAIVIVGDTVMVSVKDEERILTTQEVSGLGRFVGRAGKLRVVLAAFPDFEVAYIIDLAQQGYGYAVNLQVPAFSERSYAPKDQAGRWRVPDCGDVSVPLCSGLLILIALSGDLYCRRFAHAVRWPHR